MPDVIKEVGAVAGIGAFISVSVLALLYFSQARDLRRLRDWAGRAPERAAEAEEALAAYESGTTEVEQPQPPPQPQEPPQEQPVAVEAGGPPDGATETPPPTAQPPPTGTRAPAPVPPAPPPKRPEGWQLEAEAAAAAELSERRERIRERSPYTTTHGSGFGVRSPLVVLAGGAILLFALIFGAIQLFGGGDSSQNPAQTTPAKKGGGALTPGKIKVAVLNGTAVPGLAASVGDDVRNAGFKLGAVTNTESSFDTTVVMYRRGHQPEGELLAKDIDITNVELMTAEIERVSKGANVAVVVGQDRAPAGAEQPGTTTPGVTPTPGTPGAPTATP
jgi:LytR cell envelope-related transcriptional attenuator